MNLKIYTSALFLFTFLSFVSLKAQPTSFTISPASGVIDTTISPSDFVILDFFQTNVTSGPITIAYTKIQETTVPGWYYSMCDLGTCYPFLPTQDTMDAVDPQENGFMGLNVDPTGNSGTTVIRYYVYNAQNPSDGDTITWIINTTPVGTAPATEAQAMKVHPIPADDQLNVSIPISKAPQGHYAILDISGKTLRTGRITASDFTIPTSDLPEGCYFLKVTGAQKATHTQRFLVQHH